MELPFKDASAIEPVSSYNKIVRSGFHLTVLHVLLLPKVLLGSMVERSPVFSAMLTQTNGGAALAVGFSHIFIDGVAALGMERL